jgi:hypothetical protein
MFKKELADILRQTGWFLAAVAVLPIPLIILKWAPGPYLAVFIPALQPGLVFWSLFLGASLFGRERGQRAMEYALSTPHSRFGLLGRLAGARLLILTALFLTAWTASGIAKAGTAVFPYPALALAFCLPLFLVSLSLSVLIENFIALCLFSLLGWYAAGTIIFRFLWGFGSRFVDLPLWGAFAFTRPDFGAFRMDFSLPLILLQIILPVVPFVAALIVSFNRFDVRRSSQFIRRYTKTFVASLAFCGLAACAGHAAANSLAYKLPYLTQDLKLIEWTALSRIARIHGEGSILKIRLDSNLWTSWDDGSSLFVEDFNGNLNRVDLSTGRSDRLYLFDGKLGAFWSPRTYGSTIAFFEKGSRPNEIQLVCLDQGTKKTDRRIFIHDAFDRGAPTLIGTDVRDGIRFWICQLMRKANKSTLRLWDDGRVEEILVKGQLETVNMPHVINGLLFFTGREPMIVLQDNGQVFELRKEFPAEEIFHARDGFFGRMSLDSPKVPFIYGKRGAKLARMDMATLEIEDIGDWSKGDDSWGFVFRGKDRFYFAGGSRSRKNLDFYDLTEGRLRLVRSFPRIDTGRRDTRFDIHESGIVITQGKQLGVYAFPDLLEIRY